MRNRLTNQSGLTLIEMLVTIVIFSIIGSLLYTVLINGLNTELRIHTETLIRDEADLVMSQIVNELYALPALKIKDVSTENENLISYKLEDTTKTLGFIGKEAKIDGSAIHSSAFDFSNSKITKEGSSIRIVLEVRSEKNKKAKPLILKSQFGLLGGTK
jgi:prepilin-type N-terminal cleavage/methylation domain-containing protein